MGGTCPVIVEKAEKQLFRAKRPVPAAKPAIVYLLLVEAGASDVIKLAHPFSRDWRRVRVIIAISVSPVPFLRVRLCDWQARDFVFAECLVEVLLAATIHFTVFRPLETR